MQPKFKRDRLFKKSRPFIRPLQVFEGEMPSKDVGLLWVAYQKGSIPLPKDIVKEEFITALVAAFGIFNSILVVEDDNRKFKDGRGIIGLILSKTNGWKLEPKAIYFDWATKKNILRSAVAYMQWARYSKDAGVCEVRTINPVLPKHMIDYGVIRFVGKMPGGNPAGDEYIYSIRCRKDGINP